MYKILIIEDEALLSQALQEKLSNDGFEVSTAVNGKDGFKEAFQNGADFILLDLIMPEMNGATTLRHLQEFGQTQNIPVAILSNVTDGVPQSLDGPDVFQKIVKYWQKDKTSLKEISNYLNSYLSSHPNGKSQ